MEVRRRPTRTEPSALVMPPLRRSRAAVLLLSLTACDGAQSALSPAGRDAERVLTLFWVMVAGAAVVWLVVMGSAVYAARADREHSEKTAGRFIVFGGVVFPVVTITALLIYGLALLPPMLDLGPREPRLEVVGEQFWWRARYRYEDGWVEVANELHLPTGERTAMTLESPDVIHSFWVPALGGKVDTIPGRTNHLALEPTRAGTFRGACAEYCGQSHALMALHVVAEPPEEFERWLAEQARPAVAPEGAGRRGAALFLGQGCGACHTIRGTAANGTLGPDLTHLGSRAHLAGVLPNDADAIARFIRDPEAVKPDAQMPAFTMSDDEADAIASYLTGLR